MSSRSGGSLARLASTCRRRWRRDRPRPFGFEPLSDAGLAPAAAIGIGRVEAIDAGVRRAVHQLERLRLVLAKAIEFARRSHAAEIAAPQAKTRNLQASRDQPPIVH